MSRLMISTQILENYGTMAEPYWKAKGGNDYFVRNVHAADQVSVIIDAVRVQIESDNEYYREYIIHHEIVTDAYLTPDEQLQLDFEGRITTPATEVFYREPACQNVTWKYLDLA